MSSAIVAATAYYSTSQYPVGLPVLHIDYWFWKCNIKEQPCDQWILTQWTWVRVPCHPYVSLVALGRTSSQDYSHATEKSHLTCGHVLSFHNEGMRNVKGLVEMPLSLSLFVLIAIFLVEPWLASSVGAKGDGGHDDNWSYKMCKAPVKS